MPCDYTRYPPDWKAIRARILARAGNRCEQCGVHNHEAVFRYRNQPGRWRMPHGADQGESDPDVYPVSIVLTIAHLDHDETNHAVTDERLQALCQRCHLRYDGPEKLRRRREKARTILLPLFIQPTPMKKVEYSQKIAIIDGKIKVLQAQRTELAYKRDNPVEPKKRVVTKAPSKKVPGKKAATKSKKKGIIN